MHFKDHFEEFFSGHNSWQRLKLTQRFHQARCQRMYDGTAKFSSHHECEHENQDHGKASSPTTTPPAITIVTNIHIKQFLMVTPT